MLNLATYVQIDEWNQNDVFVVDGDGILTVSWQVGTGAWNGPTAISPPGLFPPAAAVTASWQFGTGQTDVFVVDKSGTLNVVWVVGAGAWNGPTAISPPGLFPPGAAVAASNQFGIGNQTDVFVVDNTGTLNVLWCTEAWHGPTAISPPGLFPPGAAVAASNQFGIGNQTDVFAVDQDGTLNLFWVVGSGAWNGPISISQPGGFTPGAAVAALNVGTNFATEVFAVDQNGNLNIISVLVNQSWYGESFGPSGLLPPGAPVAASNQFGIPDQTDVFVVDKKGALNVASVVGNGSPTGPTAIGQSGLFPPGSAVVASNQFGNPDQTNVFAVDGNGTLNVAWIIGNGAWNGPVPVYQEPVGETP